MNFVISKNSGTKAEKSEAGNTKNRRKNSMLEFSIYKAIEYKIQKDFWKQKDFQNREEDRRDTLDKYIYVRCLF